ncbi:hypothetical protein [Spongiactinospora sp. 9N601]|uniref:hypothetical protein n=1 Tax=Spongiactinospora sp. 9N601 TaxID=3375149 RepID=UPI0037ADB860
MIMYPTDASGEWPGYWPGIAGIRRRVTSLDGGTRVTSPPGGPTTLEVTLPCAS